MQAELEMVQIMDGIFQTFKAKRSTYVIKLNSRVLVNEVLKQAGINADNVTPVIRLIDRLNKMPTKEFVDRLDELTGDKAVSAKIVSFLQSNTVKELDPTLLEMESVRSLNAIIGSCKELGISNIEFDTSLMRGFDYYTDIVFEAFDTDPENNRSMFGGGRYDGLVAQFGADPIPTVGFGMGDMTFQNFLESHGLIPDLKLSNDLTVVIRDQSATNAAFKAAKELREIGVNTAVDYSGRKIDKQLKNAIKSGVRYVLFVGEENANEDLYTLKDMKTGKEEKHSLARIVSIVKDSRK